MAAVGTALHVVEQLASHRTAIAMAVGDYMAASDSVLAWYGAGRPSTPEDVQKLGEATQGACSAVLTLEGLVVGLANDIRAAQTPAIPPTIGAQAVRA